MTGAASTSQRPWRNKFQRPDPDSLLASYEELERTLGQNLRTALRKVDGIEEELSWQGVPWRWTFVYRLEGDPTEAFAYLVPTDERPLLSLPLTVEMVESLAGDKIKRTLKSEIMHSRFVGGVYWPAWEVGAKSQVAELRFLMERKARVIRSQTTR